MDQIFLILISCVPDTDWKFLIHINSGIWIRPIFAVRGAMDQIFLIPISWIHINVGIWIRPMFAVRGAMDQIFLIPISWVPDTDQKFMIHINFGICGAMDQKFLIPMLGSHGSEISDPKLLVESRIRKF